MLERLGVLQSGWLTCACLAAPSIHVQPKPGLLQALCFPRQLLLLLSCPQPLQLLQGMLLASVSPSTHSNANWDYSRSLPFHLPGHVFNMPHDNVKACEEVFGRLKTNHMMSPTLIQIDRANPWSACSAAIITDFLDSGHGELFLFSYPCPHAVLIPVMVMGTGCWGRQQISPCSPNKSRRKQRAEWCFSGLSWG